MIILYRLGSYVIYFFREEDDKLVHVHVSANRASEYATKLYITSDGNVMPCHNKSGIPVVHLREIADWVYRNRENICDRWVEEFGKIEYYS